MRIRDEPNVDVLRTKAGLLEAENVRLSKQLAELMRENLRLKGMSAEAIELNLPGLCQQVTAGADKPTSPLTRPGSEGRRRDEGRTESKQRGHGPTEQPQLEVVQETFKVDEADKVCPECGLDRYTIDVAITAAVGKHIDHLPLDRQARMAKRQGLAITSQALWDQVWALSELLAPLCARIKRHLLEQPVIGADETGFKLIQKGGSVKWQAWQLSCPEAIYFEVLPSKHASVGEKLFVDENGDMVFGGTAVMDGAAELAAIAGKLGFEVAGCWSHARRDVLKAEKEAPGQVAQFLDLVGDLYAIERKAIRGPPEDPRRGYRHLLDVAKLQALRGTESRAKCDEIRSWIEAQTCIPGGLLKKGLDYIAARWSRLTRFLDDSRIPLDNNLTEGRYIGLAIGRRNYVGARSERGCLAAGRFYTIVESAHVNGADGEAYLRYAAKALLNKDEPMLPHEWASARS
jgi:transposase